MKLVLSDRPVGPEVEKMAANDLKIIDLSHLNISNCMGCFGCWTKTPGRCVIRDAAVDVYPLIAESDDVIYVSRLVYGGYDSVMKTMLERAIPVQQAFIRMHEGETHHVQRNVESKNAVIIAYGDISDDEKNIFKKLIERNAKNMSFKDYRIVFTSFTDVEETIVKEISKWQK